MRRWGSRGAGHRPPRVLTVLTVLTHPRSNCLSPSGSLYSCTRILLWRRNSTTRRRAPSAPLPPLARAPLLIAKEFRFKYHRSQSCPGGRNSLMPYAHISATLELRAGCGNYQSSLLISSRSRPIIAKATCAWVRGKCEEAMREVLGAGRGVQAGEVETPTMAAEAGRETRRGAESDEESDGCDGAQDSARVHCISRPPAPSYQ